MVNCILLPKIKPRRSSATVTCCSELDEKETYSFICACDSFPFVAAKDISRWTSELPGKSFSVQANCITEAEFLAILTLGEILKTSRGTKYF